MSARLFSRMASAIGLSALLVTPGLAISSLSTSGNVSGPGRNGCSLQGTGAVAVSDLSCPTGATGQYRVSADASASYGTLQAVAQAGFDNVSSAGTAIGAQASAQANFKDDITLDVVGRTGEVVDLVITARLSGSASASIAGTGIPLATAGGGLRLTVGSKSLSINNSWDSRTGPSLFDTGPLTVQITLGQPFQLEGQLGAVVGIRDLSGTSSIITITQASALASFGNSGGPTSFELFDLGGAPILAYSLSSGSGQFQFFVPEPGLGLLLGAALAAARFSRRLEPRRFRSS